MPLELVKKVSIHCHHTYGDQTTSSYLTSYLTMGCLALVLLGPISCSGSCLARPYLMSFESELGRSHIVRKLISRWARVKG